MWKPVGMAFQRLALVRFLDVLLRCFRVYMEDLDMRIHTQLVSTLAKQF